MDYRTLAKRRKKWTNITVLVCVVIIIFTIYRNNCIIQPTLQRDRTCRYSIKSS